MSSPSVGHENGWKGRMCGQCGDQSHQPGLVGSLLQLLRLFLWRLASARHCDIWQVLIMPNRQWLDEAALSRFQTSWPRDSLLHQAPRHLKCNLCSWNRPRDGCVNMFEGWNVETSVHQRLHRMGKNQRPIHKTVRCKDVQSHSCSGIVCTHGCQSIATKAPIATKERWKGDKKRNRWKLTDQDWTGSTLEALTSGVSAQGSSGAEAPNTSTDNTLISSAMEDMQLEANVSLTSGLAVVADLMSSNFAKSNSAVWFRNTFQELSGTFTISSSGVPS